MERWEISAMRNEGGLVSKIDRGRLALIGLVALGTLLRLLAALHTQEWKLNSQHGAWQLLLEEATGRGLHLDQLMAYPHEMGGVLVSLIALVAAPLGPPIPSLSLGALCVDTLSRLAQVWITDRIAGRQVAVWFAIWTVAAVPSLIPWSFVAVGQHASAAVFPFLLIWLASGSAGRLDRPWRLPLGLTLGLAIAWTYSALTLLPVALFAVLAKSPPRRRLEDAAVFLTGLAGVLLPALLLREWLYEGFGFEGFSPFWTQVTHWEGLSPSVWAERFRLGWSHSLPGATVLPSLFGLSIDTTRLLWALLVYGGLTLALIDRRRGPAVTWGAACVVCFMVFYPVNALWLAGRDLADHSAYLYFQPFPLILPLAAMLAIRGMSRLGRAGWAPLSLLILIGLAPAFQGLARDHEPHQDSPRARGWVLGRMLGHDPDRFSGLIGLVPEEQRGEFAVGYGWGMADAALKLGRHPASESPEMLARALDGMPSAYRGRIVEGVAYAFEVTPGLDSRLKAEVLGRVD